ncbi:MAG: hypothetical protein M3070_01910 [Actinomycetota bacterium]|nr:hypothetical protein [Actinomycetota bacterium]
MFRKLALAGATAAVVVGVGTTALAVSGEPQTTTGHAAGTSKHASGKHGKRAGLRKALRHVAHAEFVTKGKDAGFVKHDAIVGQVTSVSATSISVKAADGVSMSFVVDNATHVRKRADSAGKAKGAPAKITDVGSGDQVAVLGKEPATSTANPTATVVIDGVRAKK